MHTIVSRLCGALLAAALLVPSEALLAERYRGLPVHGYEIVERYPHDPDSFTQGLVLQDGVVIEGTGLWGRSRLRSVELASGRVLADRRLPDHLFGEGVAVTGERIVQLTYKARLGLVYQRDGLVPLDTFRYATEGWGLAFDGGRLIKSDGSATLEFLDPRSFVLQGSCEVTAGNTIVTRLNELEMVDGLLYANVWGSDYIARIDLDSCRVRDWVDLAGLARDFDVAVDVLNGIAYDAAKQQLIVTGKLWPSLFEIRIRERE